MTDIDKLKALALAATPGEWKVERLQGGGHHNVGIRVRGPIVSGFAAALNTRWANEAQAAEQEANAAYIAAACPATVLELIAEVERLRADAKRYRWLMENKVRMRTADSYGPACPALEFFADRWNERPDLSPQERIDMEISAAIEREKE